MTNENLDPRELLSLVEGEILGDRVADAPISEDKIRELAARIRTNAGDQAEYEHLKISVNALRSPERSMLLVTHYQRLLNYIVPDFVHVLANGRIQKSGGKELALELEAKGYSWIEEGVAV